MTEDRYLETALDELYNGGPMPELEQRILKNAPIVRATPARWWLIPAACAVLALGAVAALLTANKHSLPTPASADELAVDDPAPPPVKPVNAPLQLPDDVPPARKTEPAAEPDSPANPKPVNPNGPVTITFRDTELHAAMEEIAKQSGLKIVIEGEPLEDISLIFRDVPPPDMIRQICRRYGLGLVQQGDTFTIYVPETLTEARLIAATNALMDARAEIDKLTQAKQRAERRKDEEGIAALTEKIARKEREVAELDEQIRQLNEARKAEQQPDFEPDPEAEITIDFVQKPLHTVMHYIALRTGLQIIVEGEVDVKLTVMFRDVKPKAAIQSICKANNLDYVEDGTVIIIKRRPAEKALANVVKAETEGLFSVTFEEHELVAAIMEVATVTKTQVFVPAVHEDSSGEDIEQATTKITLFMTQATPDQILRRLAELGGLNVEMVEVGGVSGYKFTWIE